MNTDISLQLQQQIITAYEEDTSLRIVGGDSKKFYGGTVDGERLDVSAHQGILNYEPTELVITARAGTLLREIEQTLFENGQMLAFEPPAYGATATLGGTLAGNFSGPRRVSSGAARDFLLGCKIINGKGEILSFGGEVMKNVAGYDVSRLMAGAMGTLGVLLELSFKVLPKPELEKTCVFECSAKDALRRMHEWGQTPLPISSTCHHESHLYVRLSGAAKAVTASMLTMGGEPLDEAENFWRTVKEHGLNFFQTNKPLWRLSLASDVDPLALEGECLYEWGGALRWISSDEPAKNIQNTLAEHDGQATLFRQQSDVNNTNNVFQPLTPGLKVIHKNLKNAFDPKGLLNPGKMYSEF